MGNDCGIRAGSDRLVRHETQGPWILIFYPYPYSVPVDGGWWMVGWRSWARVVGFGGEGEERIKTETTIVHSPKNACEA